MSAANNSGKQPEQPVSAANNSGKQAQRDPGAVRQWTLRPDSTRLSSGTSKPRREYDPITA